MKKLKAYIKAIFFCFTNIFSKPQNRKIIFYNSKTYGRARLIELLQALHKDSEFTFTANRFMIFDYMIVRVNFIFLLEDEKFVKDQIAQFNKVNAKKIIFDLSTEGLDFFGHQHNFLLRFLEILKSLDVNPSRVILLNSNSKSYSYYPQWMQKFSPDYVISLIGYNFYILEYYYECLKNKWLMDNYNLIIENSSKALEQDQYDEDKKYFMCLNLRPKGHRRAIVLFLLKNNFIDKGIVTYFGDFFGKSAEEKAVITVAGRKAELKSMLGEDEDISDYITKLEEMSPITFDRNSSKISDDLWSRGIGEVDFLIPELEFDKSFKKPLSYFEIVTESWFTDETCLYLTEKVIRPILRMNPFIIVGTPYTLKYLRSIGFKTFSPLIDESYDEIASIELRMKAIFKEIKRLCEMDKNEIHKIYQQLIPTLKHNLLHFINNNDKILKKELDDNLQVLLKPFL